jgi:hypothetical protein
VIFWFSKLAFKFDLCRCSEANKAFDKYEKAIKQAKQAKKGQAKEKQAAINKKAGGLYS